MQNVWLPGDTMTAWIRMLPIEPATGKLKTLFDKVKTPHGTVDNVLRVHGLRPATMDGHITLYRGALHSDDNTLPFWLLEVVGVYTSILNNCAYSQEHHVSNVHRLVDDPARSAAIMAALRANRPEDAFDGRELAILRYTEALTLNVRDIDKTLVDDMRAAGCDDGEILEVNQVCGYFNYANRLLNGLGVTTEGDIIGYYTADDPTRDS